MTSSLKKKKSVVPSIDANSLVDEVVQSIVKIKKQKQRPNSERIHSMILKSHPDLNVHFINESIELAIKEGLVVNHLHNGIYSYRVAIGNASQLSDKIIDDKSIEDAVKSLFYESEHQYSVDKLEVLVKCRFPQGSLFNSNLHVVIRNTCAELVERGRISHLKNVYRRKNVEEIQEQPVIDQNIDEKKFLRTEPFEALKNSSRANTPKNETVDKKYPSNMQNKTDSLYKDSKSDLKLECKNLSLKRTHDISDHNSSDDSNDKPKRRKTRSLQLSFLYDSLSSFFSVTSCKRSCTIKKPSYNMDEYSNDSITTSTSVKTVPKVLMKKNIQTKKPRTSLVNKIENTYSKQIKTQSYKPEFDAKIDTHSKIKNKKKNSNKKKSCTSPNSSQLNTNNSLLSASKVSHYTDNHFSSDTESLSDNEEKNSHKLVEAIVSKTDEQFFSRLQFPANKGTLEKGKKIEIAFGRYLLATPNVHLVNPLKVKHGKLVMCEFCLETLDTNRCLERHLLKCGRHSPPGVEIYRDNDLKLFHLNHQNVVYCNLLERFLQLLFVIDPQSITNSSFSSSNQNHSYHQQSNYKTYFSSDHSGSNSNEEENEYNAAVLINKTSHHITTHTNHHQLKTSHRSLNYFLLTIQDRSGSHLAGVLSYGTTKTLINKWNVSCLFILPQYRNQGHAKYLVNLAYNIAASQELQGTHLQLRIPLKDHVANVFLSVWCHIIVQFFIHSKQCQFSIQDISIGTGIHDKDIITALNSLKLEADFYLNDQMVDMTQGQKEELRQRVVVSKSYTDSSITFNEKLARNHTKLQSTVESRNFNCKKNFSNFEKKVLTDTIKSDFLKKNLNKSSADVTNLGGSFNSSHSSNSFSSPVKKEKNKRSSHDLSEIISKLSNQQNCKLMMAASAPNATNVENDKNNEIKNNCNEPFQHCGPSNDFHRSIEKVSKAVTEREFNCLTDNLDKKYSSSSGNLKELNKTEKSEKNSSFDEKVMRGASLEHATAVSQGASIGSHMPCLNSSGIKTSPSTYTTVTGIPHFTPSSLSSPSPPDLKKEMSRFGVASSVRSDVSEVDVGGPGSSPLKSPCKDIPSQSSSVDAPLRSEDEECKVVSVENSLSQSHLNSSSVNSTNGLDANDGFASKSLKNNQIVHNDKAYSNFDQPVGMSNKKDKMKCTLVDASSCDGSIIMADKVNGDQVRNDPNNGTYSGNHHVFKTGANKDVETLLRKVDKDFNNTLNTFNKKVENTIESSRSGSFHSEYSNCLHTKTNDFSSSVNNDERDNLNSYSTFDNTKNSSMPFGKDSQNINTSAFNINDTSNNNDDVLRRSNENVFHNKNNSHKNDPVVQKNFYNNLKNEIYNNNFNKNHNNNLNVSVNNMSNKNSLMNSFQNNNNKGKINYESSLSQRKKSEMQSESKYSVISPHPSNININEDYMQERCNSVFGDYYHSYLPHPQGTQRAMLDKRLERPATRCGFEATSYPPHCSEFRYETEPPKGNFSRSMAPPNDSYLNQLNNFPASSQATNFNNRSQRLQAPGKTSKRSGKYKNQSNSAYSSSVHATSASSFPLSPDQIFNPFYRFPNMAQNFDLANPSYLHEDLLMRNFMPSNNNSNNNESTNNNDNNNNQVNNNANNSSRNTYFTQQRQQSPSSKHHSQLLPCQPQLQQQHLRQHTQKHSNLNSQHSSMNECRMESNTATSPIDQQQHGLLLQQQSQQHPAYLNPAAYFAKLHQFHSEFSQLQYPSFFSKASSPSPIDMSLHIPPGQRTNLPEAIKSGGQNLDLFPSYNLNPYSSSFDPRTLVHRNPHAQSSLFSSSQHSSILPNQLYSSYSNETNHN